MKHGSECLARRGVNLIYMKNLINFIRNENFEWFKKKNLILRYSYFSLELLDIPFVKFASVVVAILL